MIIASVGLLLAAGCYPRPASTGLWLVELVSRWLWMFCLALSSFLLDLGLKLMTILDPLQFILIVLVSGLKSALSGLGDLCCLEFILFKLRMRYLRYSLRTSFSDRQS